MNQAASCAVNRSDGLHPRQRKLLNYMDTQA